MKNDIVKILNQEVTKINEFSEDIYYRFKDIIKDEKNEMLISEVSDEKRLIIDTLETSTHMSLKYLENLKFSIESFIHFIETGGQENE